MEPEAVGVDPCQLTTLLRTKLEGISEGFYELVLGRVLPIQIFGYCLSTHLITGEFLDMMGDVVRTSNIPAAGQMV